MTTLTFDWEPTTSATLQRVVVEIVDVDNTAIPFLLTDLFIGMNTRSGQFVNHLASAVCGSCRRVACGKNVSSLLTTTTRVLKRAVTCAVGITNGCSGAGARSGWRVVV